MKSWNTNPHPILQPLTGLKFFMFGLPMVSPWAHKFCPPDKFTPAGAQKVPPPDKFTPAGAQKVPPPDKFTPAGVELMSPRCNRGLSCPKNYIPRRGITD